MREAAWPAKAASATQYPHFFHLGYELTGERGKRPSRLKHHGLARSLISPISDIGLDDQFPLRFERAMKFQRLFDMQNLLPIQPCTRVHGERQTVVVRNRDDVRVGLGGRRSSNKQNKKLI